MGVNKRQEEQMKKILARSKLAEKKEAEQKKLAKKGKSKAKNAVTSGDMSLEDKKALRAKYSHMVTDKESGPKPAFEEPAYSYEVHGRRNNITVTVKLHKIPDQFINIDETTARKLVVDTTKYSKKWRLDFPFPKGMRVDLSKADYTLESGVLKCVFPVDNMPEEVAEETRKLVESVKAERSMRFKYDKNGDLTVRKRKATLAVPPSEKNGKSQRAKRNRDGEDDEAEGDDKKKKSKKGKKDAPGPADAPKDPKKAPVTNDATMKLIQEAAKTAGGATRKKQKDAKDRAAKDQDRQATRDDKSSKKKSTMNQSFSSLVAAQKQRLDERRAAAAPVQPKPGPRKAVSFTA